MKIKSHILLASVCLLLLSSSSFGDIYFYDYQKNYPVLMQRSNFEKAIKTIDHQDFEQTSRISFKDNYIYIVEQYRGVHVINNTDTSSPQNEHFILIPGCMDMAIKDDIMYARSAEDLVAINISNLPSIELVNRTEETFPEVGSPYEGGDHVPYKFSKAQRPENTVIVAWINKE
jgi:hypothetical protein